MEELTNLYNNVYDNLIIILNLFYFLIGICIILIISPYVFIRGTLSYLKIVLQENFENF